MADAAGQRAEIRRSLPLRLTALDVVRRMPLVRRVGRDGLAKEREWGRERVSGGWVERGEGKL